MFVPLSIFLQKSSGVATVVLSGLVAYQFALLTWSFSPVQDSKYQWVAPKIKATSNGNKINTQKLQQQHLFGESKGTVKNSGAVSSAPKTKLNVILVGVVAASEPQLSSAIISYQSKQDSYFIDSKIEGTGATVSEIYEDRVILDVNGSLQTLMLDGVENMRQQDNHQAKAAGSKVVAETNVKPVDIEIDRSTLLKDPGKLTDYIRISPYRRDGEVAGYRLKPGKDRTLFDQAGLKNGDLAIELNGVDLTDTQQAFSLMKEFPTMTEMSLTVDRNGQLHELYLNIQ